ncbi:hypothetical protein PIROE2DRAFT_14780 [Piromyces sp. E2]|nr:hypothetical protein PIROE2DRAFT_14780 [Piromyces sp. E2]|eukprot:OUM59633.1 hypothetical protein PIROE2DRAFT_14780 [Piromyces sp. E2]
MEYEQIRNKVDYYKQRYGNYKILYCNNCDIKFTANGVYYGKDGCKIPEHCYIVSHHSDINNNNNSNNNNNNSNNNHNHNRNSTKSPAVTIVKKTHSFNTVKSLPTPKIDNPPKRNDNYYNPNDNVLRQNNNSHNQNDNPYKYNDNYHIKSDNDKNNNDNNNNNNNSSSDNSGGNQDSEYNNAIISNNDNNDNNNNLDKKPYINDKDGVPFCHKCNVLTIDENGVKWGFEDVVCKIETEYCDKQHDNYPPLRGDDMIRICIGCNYTKVEQDKTMWGQEKNEKCRVISSRCPNANVSDYQFCKGCNVVSTGNDYCLFGYEEGPCIINEIECGILSDSRFLHYLKRSKGYSLSRSFILMGTLILTTVIILS